MKNILNFCIIIFILISFSCRTVDQESVMSSEETKKMKEENERLQKELNEKNEELEVIAQQNEYVYDIEPVVIPKTSYVVVDREGITDKEINNEEKKLTGKEAVKQSLKDSIIDVKEYVGGTSIFDYDENVQFPIFTKKLAMTTIILNKDEAMVDTKPYLSDTSKSWVITGDIWSTDEGERQLIMIKPTETGLETNMMIITNKRLYHFVLYSTKDNYQPMVKFRYPTEGEFITSKVKKSKPLTVQTHLDSIDQSLVSFNYTMSIPTFQKKVDWIPEKIYDDGSHTYILLPEIVLQKELPVVWEGKEEITNYEMHPEIHNLMIINKLIDKITLKLGKEKVTITKKKGVPKI